MPKLIVLDSYYPEAIRALPFNPASTYESNLKAILYQSFGTGDFYSRNLERLGWEAVDIIANHFQLQFQWSDDHGSPANVLEAQIAFHRPDVVFLQDLSIPLPRLADGVVVAGQCSCPWPGDANIRKCKIVWTSFPHYLAPIEALGVKAMYLPLAFDPIVLERITDGVSRDLNCVFIGGVGAPSHWSYGMQVLNAVAEQIPTFKWWGYGAEQTSGALREKYQGSAWGLEMYRILLHAKICLNRHGEVAGEFANNMRMYEATGCGSMLLTEEKINLDGLFADDEVVTYSSPTEAVQQIEWYLQHSEDRAAIAHNGFLRTQNAHTYFHRMQLMSDTLRTYYA